MTGVGIDVDIAMLGQVCVHRSLLADHAFEPVVEFGVSISALG